MGGLSNEDVDITLNNNVLTIRGETKIEEKKTTAINICVSDGLTPLPKAEAAKPKHIQIQTNGSTSKTFKLESKESA
jgi:hypothetical protein